jgi:hypothetical protein
MPTEKKVLVPNAVDHSSHTGTSRSAVAQSSVHECGLCGMKCACAFFAPLFSLLLHLESPISTSWAKSGAWLPHLSLPFSLIYFHSVCASAPSPTHGRLAGQAITGKTCQLDPSPPLYCKLFGTSSSPTITAATTTTTVVRPKLSHHSKAHQNTHKITTESCVKSLSFISSITS